MTDIYNLQIKITANGAELVNAGKAGKQALADLGAQGKRAGGELDKGSRQAASALTSVNAAAKAATLGITALGAAWGGINFAKAAYESTQAMARLTQGLTAVKGSAQAAATDIAYLRKLAMESGRTVQDLGKDWLQFSASLEGAGVSSSKQQRIFDQLTKTFAILGKTSAESSLAIRGAQQVVGSGTANLEDLKQVTENAGLSMTLFADAAGLSMADFKKAVSDGTISGIGLLERFSDLVSGKFKGALNDADRSAADLAQAWDDVKRSFGEDFVPGVAEGMKALASAMKDPAFVQAMRDFGQYLGNAIKDIASYIGPATQGVGKMFDMIKGGAQFLPLGLTGTGGLIGNLAAGAGGSGAGGAPLTGKILRGDIPLSDATGKIIARAIDAGKGYTTVLYQDGTTEVRQGSFARRNNNPGNIEAGAFARKFGAIPGGGRFALFPTLQAGLHAQESLLFDSPSYRNLTLSQGIARWAPPSENNTGRYISTLLNAAGGHDRRLGSYSAAERQALLAAMAKHEGFGTIPSLAAYSGALSPLRVKPKEADKHADSIKKQNDELSERGLAIKSEIAQLQKYGVVLSDITQLDEERAKAVTLGNANAVKTIDRLAAEVRQRETLEAKIKAETDATSDQKRAKESALKAANDFFQEADRELLFYSQSSEQKTADKVATDLLSVGEKELAAKVKERADRQTEALEILKTQSDLQREAADQLRQHTEDQANFNQGMVDQIESYRAEREALQLATGEGEAYRVVHDAIYEAKKKNLEISPALLEQLKLEAKMTEEVRSAKAASDEIRRSLTDALLRGFESGKDFAANFKDTLMNMFKTLVLRPIIEPIAGSAADAVLGLFGVRQANGTTVSASGAGGFNVGSAIEKVGSGLSKIGDVFSGKTSFSGLFSKASTVAGYNGGGIASYPAAGSQLGFNIAGLGSTLSSSLGAFGVGSLASNLLGGLFGVGNSKPGQLGSTLGSGLGALANFILPGAGFIASPILGMLGGLFGDMFSSPPRGSAQGAFSGGRFVSGFANAKGGGEVATATGPLGALAQSLEQSVKALGLNLDPVKISAGFKEGMNQFWASGPGIRIDTGRFKKEDTQAQIGAITQQITEALLNSQGAIYLRRANAAAGGGATGLQFAAQIKGIYEDLGTAIDGPEKTARKLSDTLTVMGVSFSKAEASLDNTSPALDTVAERFNYLFKTAIEGGYVSPDTLANWQKLGQIINQVGDTVEANANALTSAYDSVNSYVLAAKTDFISALKQEAANDRAYFKSLRDFRADLVTGGQTMAAPQDRLKTARRQFYRLASQVKGGDLSAIPDLQNAAGGLLDQANSFYGGTGRFGKVAGNVDSILAAAQAEARKQAKAARAELRGIAPEAVKNQTLDDLRKAFEEAQRLFGSLPQQYAHLQEQINQIRSTGATLSPETQRQIDDLIDALGAVAKKLQLRDAA